MASYDLPIQFSKPVLRPVHTSMFGFTKDLTIVSYIPKKWKNVVLESSMHHHDKINNSNRALGKPEIIMDYNITYKLIN